MAAFTIDPAAACVDGHFPGRPVVPGVVIVDRAIRLIVASDDVRIHGLRRVKFPGELPPGVDCRVDWAYRPGRIRFACRAGGRLVTSDTLDAST